MKIKEQYEKREAAAKSARDIIAAAEGEKRDLTADELTKLDGFQSDVENRDKAIAAETRQLAIDSKKAPKLTKGEERDVNRFDLGVVLRHMKSRLGGGISQPLDGVEAELIAEGEKEARSAGIDVTGLVLPRTLVRRQGAEDIEQRDMTAGTDNQGGYTVATTPVGLADAFYNASVLRQNGATVLEDLRGDLDLPRYIAPSDPAKKAENATADELSPTAGVLSLTPRRLPAFIDISDQLLKQSNVAIEAIVRKNLTEQMLAVQEVSFFHGGGTNEPTGIAATSGIGSVAGGTNGLAPAWSHIVDLESEVANVNAATGNLRYLTNTKVRGKLKQTVKVASTDSRMIWENGEINDVAPVITNAVSSALTKGTSSGVCSAIFYGNVSDFVIGYWGGIQLELIRDGDSAKAGKHILVANSYYDGGVLRPASFSAMLDALTA